MALAERRLDAPGAGDQGASGRRARRRREDGFRRASIASTASSTRIADLKELQRDRARHAHRRQPQATRRGNPGPAGRRDRPAQRRRRQLRRHRRRDDRRAAQPSHSRCTPSASARNTPRTTSRSTTRWLRRARWPIRGWPRSSAFTSAATRGRKSKLVVRDGTKRPGVARRDARAGRQRPVRNAAVQRRRRRRQGAPVLDRAAAGRRERRQQRRHAAGQRRVGQAPRAVRRRRAALGVQVHPARGRRRPHRAARLDAAHHREQDLPPGHPGSQGAGRRVSRRAPRICSRIRRSSSARWKRPISRRRSRS